MMNTTGETKLKTRWPELDELTGGFTAGQLICICSRPGAGKTTLALRIAANLASEPKNVVAIFSSSTSQEIGQRLTAQVAGVPVAKIKSSTLGSDQWDALGSATKMLAQSGLVVSAGEALTVSDISRQCASLQVAKSRLDLVIVDGLQLLGDAASVQQDEPSKKVVTEKIQVLKDLAEKIQCPVVVLSQLPQDVTTQAARRPTMLDLGCAGEGSDLDVVIFLHRDGTVTGDSTGNEPVEVIVVKNNTGKAGSHVLRFDSSIPRFVECAE